MKINCRCYKVFETDDQIRIFKKGKWYVYCPECGCKFEIYRIPQGYTIQKDGSWIKIKD